QFVPEFAVVVDLAVDRQHQAAVGRTQRLRTAGRVDDRQPLVDQDRAGVVVDTAPVRATVALQLRQFQRLPPQRLDVVSGLQPEHAENRTHRSRTPGRPGHPGRTRKRPAPCDAGLHWRRCRKYYARLQPASRTRLFAARLRLRTFALRKDCRAMARRYRGAPGACNSCRHNRHQRGGILTSAAEYSPGAGRRPGDPSGGTTLSETMQRLSRTSQVVAMLARYRRAGILTGFDLGEAEEDPVDGETDELAERFVADLEAMGPAFVKLGQALSTRPDLVPASWITALERTQDDATPAPVDDIEALLEKELGVRASKVFSEIDPEPMAAASLAQVHR